MDNGAILVPLDGSTAAEQALPAAKAIAAARGAQLRLVHVVDEREGARSASDLARARGLFAAYASDVAKRNGITLAEGATDVLLGSPAERILEAGQQASMIVIASHGRGGFHATFIGSVADKVVRGARVPVLVVPGRVGDPAVGSGPVLVALDGSEEAERALPAGRELAAKLGVGVVLVRAWSLPPPAGVEFGYYPADFAETLAEAAETYLKETARPGEQALVVSGQSAAGVVDAAREVNAGMVVMASGGKGLARRIALGSTTDRVLHTLQRALLIIPPAE